MEFVVLLGRILFVMIFVGAGIGHLVDTPGTAAAIRKRGLANAELLARVSGVTLLAGGLCVALGVFMDVVLLGLAAQVLLMGFLIHPFWTISDPEEKQVEMSLFMKNLCIAGACIQLSVLAMSQPFTLTAPLIFS